MLDNVKTEFVRLTAAWKPFADKLEAVSNGWISDSYYMSDEIWTEYVRVQGKVCMYI